VRSELQRIVDDLVSRTKEGDEIDLDTIGEAIGSRLITQDDIARVLTAIEERGRKIRSPQGGEGEATLKRVLSSARVLKDALGRSPRADEIAKHAGLELEKVRHALELSKIIQR
jgi:hypothetical protein